MPRSDQPRAESASATGDAAVSSSPPSAPPSVVAGSSPTSRPAVRKPRASDDSGAGAVVPPPPNRDCRECISYLTHALDSAGSRPMSLLRALGVITHDGGGIARGGADGGGAVGNEDGRKQDDGGRERGRVYELMDGGRGVLISLSDSPASHREATMRTRRPRGRGDPESVVPPIVVGGGGGTAGVLTTSPAIANTTMITTIAIECAECRSDTRAEAGARAFVSGPDKLGIVLCSNRLSSQAEIDEVLVHELVHIYDAHSRQMDLRDCRQLAYSEVRAAREAECSNRMTQFTANICAKDTATRATRNMFPENGRQCVCDVFDVAVKDLAPFDVEEDAKNVAFWKAGYGGGGVSRKGPSPPPPARQPSVFVEKQQPQQSSPLFPPPRWSDR